MIDISLNVQLKIKKNKKVTKTSKYCSYINLQVAM